MRIFSAPIARNLIAVMGGALIAQVLAFAFSPLITRIYGPEAFGIQGVFIASISLLWPVAALRYPMAIVVAESDAEVRGLIRLSLCIAAAVSGGLAIILLGMRRPLLSLFGMEQIGPLIWFLPLALFLVAIQDTTDFKATRLGAFRTIGVVTALQALVVNLTRVIGGLINPTAAALIIVTSISYGAQASMLKLGLQHRLKTTPSAPPDSLIVLACKYREFPLFRMPADIISAASQTAPVFLLSILFSPATSGLYILARAVVNLPLSVIGSAAGNVFYARIADMERKEEAIYPFILKATLAQLFIPGGATMLVAITFPYIFVLIFGEPWRAAGEFAQWMTLWAVCMLANIPTVRALPVIGRQNLHLFFNIIIAFAGVVGLFAGYTMENNASGAVRGYSISTALSYALQIGTYLYHVRRHDLRRGRA